MKNIEEKICEYGALELEEQQEIDRYVEIHPEYASLLADMKKMYAMFNAAGLLDSGEPDDAALAYYVMHETMQAKRAASALASPLTRFFEQIRSRLNNDSNVHARYLIIKTRMESLAAEMDPVAHFEQLTGNSVASIPSAKESLPTGLISGKRNGSQDTGNRSDRPPVVREPAARGGRHKFYVLAAVVAGMLIVLNMNRSDRLGYVSPGNIALEMPAGMRGIGQVEVRDRDEVRSGLSPDVQEDWERFRDATEKTTAAQSVYLGIYYTSDQSALEEARQLFEGILNQEHVDPRLRGYTMFMLAKINIVLNEKTRAAALLTSITEDTTMEKNDAGLVRQAGELLQKLQ